MAHRYYRAREVMRPHTVHDTITCQVTTEWRLDGYDVQIYTTASDGRVWYAGTGRMCRTRGDARAYAEAMGAAPYDDASAAIIAG